MNSCRNPYPGYLDNRLTEPERRSVALHLEVCRDCATTHDRTARLRGALRSLPWRRALRQDWSQIFGFWRRRRSSGGAE